MLTLSLLFTLMQVEYMDYPTHVVIKSAKVIPIMVMGFFILGVRPLSPFLATLATPILEAFVTNML